MKKTIKSKAILICVCLLLALLPIIALAATSLDFNNGKYYNLDETEIVKELANYSFMDLCHEVNVLSQSGVELSDLLFHSTALAEKSKDVPTNVLFDVVDNKKNSENLRIICLQVLDFYNTNLDSEYTLKLKAIVLDETEKSLIRQNAVWLLPACDETVEALERVITQDDEMLAFQALKKLNYESPKRARVIAEDLIHSEEQNEKLRIAIKVISSQLSKSNSSKEKDQWLDFCMNLLQQRKCSNNKVLQDTIIFSLSDLYYSKAIFEIINCDSIDNSQKVYCINQNYQVLIDCLNNNPQDEDIEMVIKAMDICPIDKTVEALESAVNRSGKEFNLESILSQELIPANEKWVN